MIATTHEQPFSTIRRDALIVLFAAVVCGLPTLGLPLGRDHGIGLYIADVVLQGGAPYKDAWEIRPPGIFYVYAAGIAAFGKNALALRLLDLLLHTLTALALCLLGNRMFGRSAGLFAGLLYPIAYFMGNDFWTLGNTDGAVALPSTLALLLILNNKRGPRLLIDTIAGLLIGAAFLVRFTQGLVFLPGMALIFVNGARSKPYAFRRRIIRFIFLCTGFALMLLGFLAYLVSKGAWDDFFYTLFVFAPKYAVLTYAGGLAELLSVAARLHLHFIMKYSIVTFPALAALAWALWKERSAKALAGFAWLAATVMGMDIMAKFYAYHWLPIFAPLALLAGFFLGRSFDSKNPAALKGIGLVVLIGGTVLFFVRFGPVYSERLADGAELLQTGASPRQMLLKYSTIDQGGDFSAAANYEAADYIRNHTKPDDPIYVWGFETLIYYLADRNPPTRFCSNYPIVAQWRREDWVRELAQSLEAGKPKYIMLVTQDEMPWITGHGLDSLSTLSKFPSLRRFILDHYEIETTIENIHICRLKTPSPSGDG